MNILYTIDGNFLMQLATAMCAVCENNKEFDSINFYVIGENISTEEKQKIILFVQKYDRQVFFYDLNEAAKEFDNLDTGGWNQIILARLLVARFLPEEIDKVLYMDADTMVVSSLKDLWDIDLKNSVIAGVVEPTVDKKRKALLSIKDSEYYINSGVLLINLAAWRDMQIEIEIRNYIDKNAKKLFASDQDVINAVLKNKIQYLDPSYNYCNTFYIYPYKTIYKLVNNPSYYDETTYMKAISHPKIIHFLGEDRPWRKGSTHKYKDQFDFYRLQTPYASLSDEEGWEGYFKAWNLFNTVTKPIPMMRYKIINRLIPFFMKLRAYQRKQKKARS